MEEHFVELGECACEIKVDHATNKVVVDIKFNIKLDHNNIAYIAAAPANRHASFSGSGLPFPSPDVALDGSPNSGEVAVTNSTAKINITLPNSYYAGLGTVLIPPTLYIKFIKDGQVKTLPIKVADPIAFRTLTYDSQRTGPGFYDQSLPVRSQEQVIRDSAYPQANTNAANFWGLKPAM